MFIINRNDHNLMIKWNFIMVNPDKKIMLILYLLAFISLAENDNKIPILELSSVKQLAKKNSIPANWNPFYFKRIPRHTLYQIDTIKNVIAIKATSDNAASALVREITVDLNEFPILEWTWYVTKIFQKGNISTKKGNDYPAALCIKFEYVKDKEASITKSMYEIAKKKFGQYPPSHGLDYLWANHAPIDTMVPSPFTKRVWQIVVESGTGKVNRWVRHKRNVREDFKAIFAMSPPKIKAIMIFTDTDNTGDKAISYYGDISFRKGASKF